MTLHDALGRHGEALQALAVLEKYVGPESTKYMLRVVRERCERQLGREVLEIGGTDDA